MSDQGRFKALFTGYSKGHGRYTITNTKAEGSKVHGKAITLPVTPPTLDLYEQHLAGTYGLGIIPLTDDNGCWFAVIDVDTKDDQGNPRKVDVLGLAKQVHDKKLPFIVCFSKSGGAHLYVFFAVEEPAEQVRAWMEKTASALGLGQSEIFPKQTSRAGPEDCGNWINLPYHGQTRQAVDHTGKKLSLLEFLTAAEVAQYRLPEEDASSWEPDDASLFSEGPPCLRYLEKNGGIPSGCRNDGMLAVGVYLKKRYGDDWQQHVAAYNVAMCNPTLPPNELNTVAKSLSRKDYGYRCKQAPLSAHCNRRQCLKRRYGVGKTEQPTNMSGLTFYKTPNKTDAAYVGIEVHGKRFIMQTADLLNVNKFCNLMFPQVNGMVTTMNQTRWKQFLHELAQDADEVMLPEEAGEGGYLWIHIQDFLSQKAQAKALSEILLGKPFRENDRIFFRLTDLLKFLRIRRMNIPPQELYQFLREKGGEDTSKRVSKTITQRLWSLPVPDEPEVEVRSEQVQDEVF
jgi:hypothetical protein